MLFLWIWVQYILHMWKWGWLYSDPGGWVDFLRGGHNFLHMQRGVNFCRPWGAIDLFSILEEGQSVLHVQKGEDFIWSFSDMGWGEFLLHSWVVSIYCAFLKGVIFFKPWRFLYFFTHLIEQGSSKLLHVQGGVNLLSDISSTLSIWNEA